jgi:hypothetical protein
LFFHYIIPRIKSRNAKTTAASYRRRSKAYFGQFRDNKCASKHYYLTHESDIKFERDLFGNHTLDRDLSTYDLNAESEDDSYHQHNVYCQGDLDDPSGIMRAMVDLYICS